MSGTCAKESTEQESKRLHLVMALGGHSQVPSLQQEVESLSTSPARAGATPRFPETVYSSGSVLATSQHFPFHINNKSFDFNNTFKQLDKLAYIILASFIFLDPYSRLPLSNTEKKKKTEMSCDVFPMME